VAISPATTIRGPHGRRGFTRFIRSLLKGRLLACARG
jgi:hypothetical protein